MMSTNFYNIFNDFKIGAVGMGGATLLPETKPNQTFKFPHQNKKIVCLSVISNLFFYDTQFLIFNLYCL